MHYREDICESPRGCGPNVSTLLADPACPERGRREPIERMHFVLRAAMLSFLARLQRSSTSGHPETLVACYAAACYADA